ncbi:MAG: magnesium protoporphyrin IX methyltransferase [Pseudomonadota bacterium]
MMNGSYLSRRDQLTEYFDRTAAAAWQRLTSDAPVGRVRATVRAGRDAMRDTLLSWLPRDMSGLRLLDAGCGTGALALEVARRGGQVVAVDVSPTLIELARERTPDELHGRVSFHVGDMLDGDFGEFDYLVAMDSMIHYEPADMVRMLSTWAPRVSRAMLMTFAPRTPALSLMHGVGRLIPSRSHRAPAIVPVSDADLCRRVEREPRLNDWAISQTRRISGGFYTSQALELHRR